MIRFRTGQTWKNESNQQPNDAFGLDIDGMALISGAENEPLAEVIPALLEAILRLSLTGNAQLSLPESNTELCFFSTSDGVTLHVAQLSRPAKLLRAPITLDFHELGRAAASCGKRWLRDVQSLEGTLPVAARTIPSLKKLIHQIQFTTSHIEVWTPSGSGICYQHQPPGTPSIGFQFLDPLERLCSYRPLATGALSSLLMEGSVDFRATPKSTLSLPGYPILLMTEISRQALEMTHTYLRREPYWKSKLAGNGPDISVEFENEMVEVGGHRIDVTVTDFIKTLLQAPLALRFAFVSLHSPQAHNPYLLELAHRSHEAIAHLRAVTPHAFDVPPREQGKSKSRPIQQHGKLRKLRFDLEWEQPLPPEPNSTLTLSSAGPIVTSLSKIYAFSKKGKLRYLHDSIDSGVVTSTDELLIRRGNMLWGFANNTAQWCRPMEDAILGPFFTRRGHSYLVQSHRHSVVALDVGSGNQRWSWSALRNARSIFAGLGPHVVCATSTGLLVGIHAETGALVYQENLNTSFTQAPVSFGRNWILVGQIGSASTVTCVLPEKHLVQWHADIPATSLSAPLVHLEKFWLTGVSDGQAMLYSISGLGKLLWKRSLPLSGRKLSLIPSTGGIIVTDAHGAAVHLSQEGAVSWRLGATGDELEYAVPPVMSRGILFVPGQSIHAIEPRAGQTVAMVPVDHGVKAIKADSRLRLFVLKESGPLSAFHLASHLSLI